MISAGSGSDIADILVALKSSRVFFTCSSGGTDCEVVNPRVVYRVHSPTRFGVVP
jgi:hypothetical protein